MKGAVRVSSTVWVGGGGFGAGQSYEGNDEVGSAEVVSIIDVVGVEGEENRKTFSTNLT